MLVKGLKEAISQLEANQSLEELFGYLTYKTFLLENCRIAFKLSLSPNNENKEKYKPLQTPTDRDYHLWNPTGFSQCVPITHHCMLWLF